MSDQTQPQDQTGTTEEAQAKQEAADYVVERAESWQEGAEPETVKAELAEGMEQAGVDADDSELGRVAEQIHDEGSADRPDVR